MAKGAILVLDKFVQYVDGEYVDSLTDYANGVHFFYYPLPWVSNITPWEYGRDILRERSPSVRFELVGESPKFKYYEGEVVS